MKTLNELYNSSCKPNYNKYKKITDKITLIDNFFQNFDSARNFFINREKWQCIEYQGLSKPGCETIFPMWVGESLMEKYILENKIIKYKNSFEVECNFFYDESDYVWSICNSSFFPHIDEIERKGNLQYICLINMNLVPVETKFYSFRNNEYCATENDDHEWSMYVKDLQNELIDYYNKTNITREEVRLFLNSKEKLDVELYKTIQYNPNQAIIYPANLYHSPNVTSEFTKENPRSILRITFYQKIIKNKMIEYS